ncbi:MAG: hypothetical protein QOF76_553, partial [Solirubrobacteraceae bacterium]|nr:hypothetical protein [Solirubrobacteraceae bacterium]
HGLVIDGVLGSVLEHEDRTVVLNPAPEAGMWRVELADGSTPIVRSETADILPQPDVKARVTGKGTKRVLHYAVKPLPGQSVTFLETARGGHTVLKTVNGGGHGTLPYALSETRGDKRTIEAEVTQDGIPRVRLEVAHYVAPNPRVGRPTVRIRRQGGHAVVRWSSAALAQRYDVHASFSDGRRLLFVPAGHARTVVIPAVGRTGGVVVRVVATSLSGRTGKAGVARIKPAGPKRPARTHVRKHQPKHHRNHNRNRKTKS